VAYYTKESNLVTTDLQSRILSYSVLSVPCPSARSNVQIADLRAAIRPHGDRVLSVAGDSSRFVSPPS
jgi:hypothetical protein